jgi:hypothetical protein
VLIPRVRRRKRLSAMFSPAIRDTISVGIASLSCGCSMILSVAGESHKYTGQICLHEKFSVSDLESSSLAGIFAIIRSNLCTRHIQKELTPRGHHDWPDKRAIRK